MSQVNMLSLDLITSTDANTELLVGEKSTGLNGEFARLVDNELVQRDVTTRSKQEKSEPTSSTNDVENTEEEFNSISEAKNSQVKVSHDDNPAQEKVLEQKSKQPKLDEDIVEHSGIYEQNEELKQFNDEIGLKAEKTSKQFIELLAKSDLMLKAEQPTRTHNSEKLNDTNQPIKNLEKGNLFSKSILSESITRTVHGKPLDAETINELDELQQLNAKIGTAKETLIQSNALEANTKSETIKTADVKSQLNQTDTQLNIERALSTQVIEQGNDELDKVQISQQLKDPLLSESRTLKEATRDIKSAISNNQKSPPKSDNVAQGEQLKATQLLKSSQVNQSIDKATNANAQNIDDETAALFEENTDKNQAANIRKLTATVDENNLKPTGKVIAASERKELDIASTNKGEKTGSSHINNAGLQVKNTIDEIKRESALPTQDNNKSNSATAVKAAQTSNQLDEGELLTSKELEKKKHFYQKLK